jgi:putative ABC transport system substrate-binding protein
MGTSMRRLEFITLVGTAAAWPLAARAQQKSGPVIGFLNSLSRETWLDYLASFQQGLKNAGYSEGQNVTIRYRWAEGHYERLTDQANDLVQEHVDLIVATGGNPSTPAAKSATSKIPIVFIVAGDPVKEGLVASLNHPGGNMTGVSIITTALEPKRLELLHELVPNASIDVVINPDFSEADTELNVVRAAAARLSLQIRILNARNEVDVDRMFAELDNRRSNALLIASDPLFFALREKLISHAAQYSIPAMYFVREFVTTGGLISYGASLSDTYARWGSIPAAFSKATKQQICRLSSLQNLSWFKSQNRQGLAAVGAAAVASRLRRGDRMREVCSVNRRKQTPRATLL